MVSGFGFGYQQKQEVAGSPGPPFALTSANNGLSVDPASFKIVLGNNTTGAAGGTAKLLSNREIDAGIFSLTILRNFLGSIFTTALNGQRVLISSPGGVNQSMIASATTLTTPTAQGIIAANAFSIDEPGVGNSALTASTAQITDFLGSSVLTGSKLGITPGGVSTNRWFINNNAGIMEFQDNSGTALATLDLHAGQGILMFTGAPETTTLSANGLELDDSGTGLNLFAGQGFMFFNDNNVSKSWQQTISNGNLQFKDNTGTSIMTLLQGGFQVFTSNALALAGGLVVGDLYRTATGGLQVVF